MQRTHDINVREIIPLHSPNGIKVDAPITATATDTVIRSREAVKNVLSGVDRRLMVVVGPCSIHDRKAGIEYARRLSQLSKQVADRLFVVMRVYFEKPRTTVGWKGLINDPHLDDSFDIGSGLRIAREILLEINELGLPAATEMLEPITPQYIADLITLASIGARTTESPTHRQMASGLSMPVGFKNGTDGSLDAAINAMQSAQNPHSFLGIDPDGRTCIVKTKGNPWGHLVLRGGRNGPNYFADNLAEAAKRLDKAKLPARLVVDCSHANSDKDYTRQSIAWNDLVQQRLAGNESLVGLMLESNLHPGQQQLTDPKALQYGVSITDGCIGWEETTQLIMSAYHALEPVPA